MHTHFPLAQKLGPFLYSSFSDSVPTYSALAEDLSSHSDLNDNVCTHSALTIELPVCISTNAGLVDHVDHQLQLLAGRDAEHCKHKIRLRLQRS